MEQINSQDLKHQIMGWGASLVGFADLDDLLPKQWQGLSKGVSIAVQLSSEIIDDVRDGPTLAYAYHYRVINQALDLIATKTMNFLQALGYRVWPVPTSQTINEDTQEGHLSHKLVATRAGLGWIGKNALLITPQYGPRIRLSSLLTNAPLETGSPVTENQCENCSACVEACPVKALKGNPWSIQSNRSDLLQVQLCSQVIERSKTTLGAPVCGVCISACPYGRKNQK